QTPLPPNLQSPPPVVEWNETQTIPTAPVMSKGMDASFQYIQPLPPPPLPSQPVAVVTQEPLPPLPVVQQPAAPVIQPRQPVGQKPAPAPECQDIPLDTKLDTNKLDILFVIDTSASMRGGKRIGMGGELAKLARAMEVFAKQLDATTDFHIGMLLGHAPSAGKKNLSGVLFQVDANDPAVIDY